MINGNHYEVIQPGQVIHCIQKCEFLLNRSEYILRNIRNSGKYSAEIAEFNKMNLHQRLALVLSGNKELIMKINSLMEKNMNSSMEEKGSVNHDIDLPKLPQTNSVSHSQSHLPQSDNILFESNHNLQSQLDSSYLQLIYEGQSDDGQKCGVGLMKTKEGEIVYEGEWKADKYEGKGILNNIFLKNPKNPGSFEDLNQMGEAWISYEGEFNDGLFNGYGSLRFCDNELFEGIFHNGKANGEGIYTFASGEKVKGVWQENILVELIEEESETN